MSYSIHELAEAVEKLGKWCANTRSLPRGTVCRTSFETTKARPNDYYTGYLQEWQQSFVPAQHIVTAESLPELLIAMAAETDNFGINGREQ